MAQNTLHFGTAPDGSDVQLYQLANARGMLVGVTNLGAALVSCRVPDGRGGFPDVTLGYDGAAGYCDNPLNLGAIIGRCANRIAGASFELAGSTYHLAANDGAHNLHSGPHRWSERPWKVTDLTDSSVTLELVSRRGDQGFPGSVQVHVTYRLMEDNRLLVYYNALPAEPTLINLSSHAYWNLNGQASGDVLAHRLQLAAERYTPLDEDLIPTGEILPVEGTAYDFRTPRELGAALDELPGGYDTNFCLDNEGKVVEVAHLVGDRSGITMDVSTDAPGMQLYATDYFGVDRAKDGARYGGFAGVALEAQYYPDAIHHKSFPQPVFTPMRPFVSTTVFAFGTSEG